MNETSVPERRRRYGEEKFFLLNGPRWYSSGDPSVILGYIFACPFFDEYMGKSGGADLCKAKEEAARGFSGNFA